MLLPLFNFILHNFLQAQMATATVFYCWHFEQALQFAEISRSNSSLFWQFVNLNETQALERSEYRYFQPGRHAVSGMFMDFNCAGTLQLIEVISRYTYFNERFHWLVYDDYADMAAFKEVFSKLNLSWNADLTYAYAIKADRTLPQNYWRFKQYDVYSNGWHVGGKLNITADRELLCGIQRCQLSRYLSTLHLKRKAANRATLSDVRLRLTSLISARSLDRPASELIEFLSDIRDPHIDPIARLGFNVVHLVKDLIGCDFQYLFTNNWSSNETSGGALGLLINGDTDLISSPYTVPPKRHKFVTLSTRTGRFQSTCMFRTPHNAEIHSSVFLEPFSATVWYLFGLALLLFAIALWYIFRVEQTSLVEVYETDHAPSLLTNLILVLASACIQGTYLMPQSTAGRIVILCLSLMSFIMYNYYTSIVVSSLLGSPVRSKIKTVAQLADSSLEVGMQPLPYMISYLNITLTPDIVRFVKRKVLSRKDPNSFWMPVDVGVAKMRTNPGFAYVFEATTGYHLIGKQYEDFEICDLNELIFRPESSLHTILNRNSSFKDLVRRSEIRLMETGVFAKHYKYWIPKKLQCLANNIVVNVGMEYAAPLFIFLVVGYMVVLIVLGIELAYQNYFKNFKWSFE